MVNSRVTLLPLTLKAMLKSKAQSKWNNGTSTLSEGLKIQILKANLNLKLKCEI